MSSNNAQCAILDSKVQSRLQHSPSLRATVASSIRATKHYKTQTKTQNTFVAKPICANNAEGKQKNTKVQNKKQKNKKQKNKNSQIAVKQNCLPQLGHCIWPPKMVYGLRNVGKIDFLETDITWLHHGTENPLI